MLQKVVHCYKNGPKKAIERTLKERQTVREIAKKVVKAIKWQSETGGNPDRKRSGKPKATAESEDGCFLRINSLCDRYLAG